VANAINSKTLHVRLRLAITLLAIPIVTSACGCQGSGGGGGGSGGVSRGGSGGGGSAGSGGSGGYAATPDTTQCGSLPDYLEPTQRCGDR